jgi:hypothetical protein
MPDKLHDREIVLSEEEIALRMNNAVRRALSTPPKALKEMVGKTKEPVMEVTLNDGEIAVLMKQDPAKKSAGGWQALLVRLQKKLNRDTGAIVLDAHDLEQIPRAAFDYGKGGFETTLKTIFGRSLGPKLGR